MQESEDSRVLIVGGGIGGLAAALALQRRGMAATIYERASELPAVGTGLQLATNGTRALAALGVLQQMTEHGCPLERFQFRSWRGRVLIDIPLGDLARQSGVPSLGVARPDLLRVLASSLDPGRLELSAECAGIEQDGAGVTARFTDGRDVRGAVLVGADGLASTVRERLGRAVEIRYPGYQYVRALVTWSDSRFPAATSWQFWGRGARFGMYPVGRGRVNWYAVLYLPEGSDDRPEGRKAEVQQRFRGWADPIEDLIAATPEDAMQRTDIHDFRPLPSWGSGRVTLLGDAAHASTPGMGRGATEALEDAVVLARCLADGQNEATLRAYEVERIPATAAVTKRSWSVGAMGRWKSAAACAARDAYFRTIYGFMARKAFEAAAGRDQPAGQA